MKTFQFSFRHDNMDLVFDIAAEDQAEAVVKMRALATEMYEADEPYVLDVGVAAYARVWVDLDSEKITTDDIVDEY